MKADVRRFRRKPTEVEAVQYDNGVGFPLAFLRDDEQVRLSARGSVVIEDGGAVKARADLGDWFVRLRDGSLVTCSHEVFEANYEEATDAN